MSFVSLLQSALGFVFSALVVIVGLALAIVPLATMRKPAEQTRKTLLILSIAAAAVLVLSTLVSTLVSLVFSSLVLPVLLLRLLYSILGAVTAMAFPIAACIGKTASPLKGLLLILPILHAFLSLISSAGFDFYFGLVYTLPASVFAVLSNLLLAVVLVLAMVWYLTGQKAALTRVVLIASPVAFVLCLILSLISVVQWTSTLGIPVGFPANFSLFLNWSSLAFPVPLRMLLIALFALAARTLGLEKTAAPVPPAPVYPTNWTQM
ncbi:hypothetical protein [Anaeromassilibacillus senegalensis]|uniref:ECF transporter S component n=1 Tax=Anaeromassilibacillus senegalensis TaxID=1673717 RepID=A0ABS9CQ96_9FIRM|nr:hypothetical protein [Anaeromassilibacillus senegalensis]MCF2652793.1 hypothetical protein [Anaeromassilibacillus senegalensis]